MYTCSSVSRLVHVLLVKAGSGIHPRLTVNVWFQQCRTRNVFLFLHVYGDFCFSVRNVGPKPSSDSVILSFCVTSGLATVLALPDSRVSRIQTTDHTVLLI